MQQYHSDRGGRHWAANRLCRETRRSYRYSHAAARGRKRRHYPPPAKAGRAGTTTNCSPGAWWELWALIPVSCLFQPGLPLVWTRDRRRFRKDGRVRQFRLRPRHIPPDLLAPRDARKRLSVEQAQVGKLAVASVWAMEASA